MKLSEYVDLQEKERAYTISILLEEIAILEQELADALEMLDNKQSQIGFKP